ncbi:MAG: hypothetical protein ACK5MQ_15670 [Pikeienuella sp.]
MGDFTPAEICDGDVVSNSGARRGRAFFIPREIVSLDRNWLVARGIEHREAPDGRLCLPADSYGDWSFVDACGNAVRLLEPHDPAHDRRREAALSALPPGGAPIVMPTPEAAIPLLLGGGFGGAAAGGGAVISGDPGTGSRPRDGQRPPPVFSPPVFPPQGMAPPPAEQPPTVVPAPASIWLLMGGLGLFALASGRRRVDGD